MARESVVRNLVVAVSTLALVSCSPATSTPKVPAGGRSSVSIELIPTGTLCITITVVGPAPTAITVTSAFGVSPQSSSVFDLADLPVGSDTFSANAYSLPCAQSTGATPTYFSNSVVAALTADVPVSVTLDMSNGGEGTIGIQFPSPGNVITEFPVPTSNSNPTGIAAGPDGNLWFTESSGSNIGRITPTGTITEFPIPTASAGPFFSICAGSDGNLWFTGANEVGRITPTGTITEFPLPAGRYLEGIASGPDGNLWFTEFDGNNIGRITPTGAITEFPIPTSGSDPSAIAAGSDGNLWFTETFANNIGRITPSGTIIEFPISARSGPKAIAAGPDGNLWFTDNVGDNIGRITPSGTITKFPVPIGSFPGGIAAGPDGNLWFSEERGNKVGRITPSGTITEFPIPTLGSFPENLAGGPDGNVWFTEGALAGNNIGRITIF